MPLMSIRQELLNKYYAKQYSQQMQQKRADEFNLQQAAMLAEQQRRERDAQIIKGHGINRYFDPNARPRCSTCPVYIPEDSTRGKCHADPAPRDGYAYGLCMRHPAVAAVIDIAKEAGRDEYVRNKILGPEKSDGGK